jgi:regulator of sirC expression with transglutaminase-like and TPR domain
MSLVTDLQAVLAREPVDLVQAALIVARLEYPSLEAAATLAEIDRLSQEATTRFRRLSGGSIRARIAALNVLFFEEEGFAGNRAHYDDFRNSLINVVLQRRLGIPISLALVYIAIARRSGLEVQGVAFPGHFLMRVPGRRGARSEEDAILDPFDAGAELDEAACRSLLAHYAGEDAPFDPALLEACTPRYFLARMLNNLKRTYVELRSYPQARRVTDLLLAVDPTLVGELRDRALLAYQLDDYRAALRDLEDYLRIQARSSQPPDPEERDQIWEHVKTLRRKVAGMN